MRADLLAAALDRGHVLELGDLVEHVADGDEQRPLVDRLEQRVQVRARPRSPRPAAPGAGSARTETRPRRRRSGCGAAPAGSRRGRPSPRRSRSGACRSCPGGAPTIRPTWSPTVSGMSHQPSPHERMPRVFHMRAYSSEVVLGGGRHRRQRVVDQVGGVGQDREAIPVGGDVHRRRLDGGEQERRRRLCRRRSG